MKRLALLASILALAGCANPQPRQQMVWNATETATVPKDQAVAKCDYDIMQNRAAYDNLSVLAGQPILNSGGQRLYETCMKAQGYRFGGTVPYTGP